MPLDEPGAGLVEAEGSYRLEKFAIFCHDSSAVLLLQENTCGITEAGQTCHGESREDTYFAPNFQKRIKDS